VPRGASSTTGESPPHRLVLASASPRRALLLEQIGWPADLIDAPAIDEAVRQGELPRAHALRLALAKAAAVAPRHPGCYVIAADTVGWQHGNVLGVYAHGLFESPAVARAMWGATAPALADSFDLLADLVDRHLDCRLLDRLLAPGR
jgi:hypothetical protein